MSRARLRLGLLVGGVLLQLLAPVRSQPLLPDPPPPLPAPQPPTQPSTEPVLLEDPSPEALSVCVPRYGHTGCAARLYARLLCAVVGMNASAEDLHRRLEADYERAAIDFSGISAAQIETAAVSYYAPMLCPLKSRQIRELFSSLAPAPTSER